MPKTETKLITFPGVNGSDVMRIAQGSSYNISHPWKLFIIFPYRDKKRFRLRYRNASTDILYINDVLRSITFRSKYKFNKSEIDKIELLERRLLQAGG